MRWLDRVDDEEILVKRYKNFVRRSKFKRHILPHGGIINILFLKNVENGYKVFSPQK
jgi:hypothetical protein